MPFRRPGSSILPPLLIGLLMPLAWWLILPVTGPLPVLLLGLGVLLWQAVVTPHRGRYFFMMVILTLLALFGHAETGMRAWPVVINLSLAGIFASSLRAGRIPLIERLARRSEPGLPPSGVRYTRRVTLVWCGFFTLNALIALLTALAGSHDVWLGYNGGISYLLTGLLMLGEWCVRRRVRRRHARTSAIAPEVVS